MVARVHHATLAKAEKNGIVITGEVEDEFYTVRWPERNKSFKTTNAPQGLADMLLLKMLTAEYPQLKVASATKTSGEQGFVISLRKDVIGDGVTLEDAWDEAADVLATGGDVDEDNETEEEADDLDAEEERGGDVDEDEGRSVVKHKYKVAYKPFRQTCGDDLSQLVSKHLKVIKDPDTKRLHIDAAKMKKFAQANGVWDPEYAKLNVGMQRMNIANRLRAKVRRDGHVVIWN